MENKVLKFKSKRGWIVPVIILLLAMPIVFIWVMPYNNDSLAFKISITCVVSIILAIFTWAVLSTYYLMNDKFIDCVSGPFKIRVFYSDITDVESSYSIWASFALSSDRVVIIRGKSMLKRIYLA